MKYTLKCAGFLLFAVFITTYCISCKASVDWHLDDATRIDVRIDREKAEFVDIIEDVRFIPLETGGKSPIIGEISKITYFGSDYYVLDREKTSGLYKYDEQGKFLNVIGRRGRGPGEYIDPADFIVNSSGVIVLDHSSKKLLFYDHDGNHAKSVPLDYIIYEITGMQDENFIFAVAGDNRHSKEAKDYEILILDVNGKFISAGIYNEYEMNYSSPYSSYLYDGKIKYSKALRSITHSIDTEGVYPDYYINILDSPLPVNYEEECNGNFERFRDNYKGKYNYFGGKFLENDKILFFTTVDKAGKPYWNMFEKKSQKVTTGSYPPLGKYIPPAGMIVAAGINNYFGCYGEDIIGFLNASALTVENYSSEFPVLEGLSQYDNPIIFRFRFKSE